MSMESKFWIVGVAAESGTFAKQHHARSMRSSWASRGVSSPSPYLTVCDVLQGPHSWKHCPHAKNYRMDCLTAGFLYRAGAEIPPNFRDNSEFLPERFWNISQRWIPKPQFWYPPLRFRSQHWMLNTLFVLAFWVYTADFGFSARGQKLSWGACHKLGSQRQLRMKTLPSKNYRTDCF